MEYGVIMMNGVSVVRPAAQDLRLEAGLAQTQLLLTVVTNVLAKKLTHKRVTKILVQVMDYIL